MAKIEKMEEKELNRDTSTSTVSNYGTCIILLVCSAKTL